MILTRKTYQVLEKLSGKSENLHPLWSPSPPCRVKNTKMHKWGFKQSTRCRRPSNIRFYSNTIRGGDALNLQLLRSVKKRYMNNVFEVEPAARFSEFLFINLVNQKSHWVPLRVMDILFLRKTIYEIYLVKKKYILIDDVVLKKF